MTVLEWNDGLNVGIGFMDHDHVETAVLINAIAMAEPADLPARFQDFLTHTEEHFGREEAMMREVGFFAYGPHKGEHDRVLAELRATQTAIAAGEAVDAAALSRHLADWLIGHRDSMDMVTAHFARMHGRS